MTGCLNVSSRKETTSSPFFRHCDLFRHCERSEAIQSGGGVRIASSLRSSQ
jgi:hypothetical protein